MTMADYWRWFVVHLWVESICEFFGIAVIALFMVAMGLATAQAALRVAYFKAALTFFSGIVGTAHHYYWYGGASFWNFLGAGIFGFLINLPIINFYEHGTYLTMHHGHTAMLGTYGMLSVALLLFSWRGLVDKAHWIIWIPQY